MFRHLGTIVRKYEGNYLDSVGGLIKYVRGKWEVQIANENDVHSTSPSMLCV